MSQNCQAFKPGIYRGGEYGRSMQQGAALVMAMVVLLILTIIGVAALNTTSLEAKMANNMQQINRFFGAAEAGIAKSMKTSGSFDLNLTTTNSYTFGGVPVTVETSSVGYSPPRRDSGYSAINYDSANFDQKGAAKNSEGIAASTIHQGASQIVNKAQ